MRPLPGKFACLALVSAFAAACASKPFASRNPTSAPGPAHATVSANAPASAPLITADPIQVEKAGILLHLAYGNGEILQGEKYRRHKALLHRALEQIHERLQSQSAHPQAQSMLAFVESAQAVLLEDGFFLAQVSGRDFPIELIAGDEYEGLKTSMIDVIVLRDEFEVDLHNHPLLVEGEILKTLQRLLDVQKFKPEDDRRRIESSSRARALGFEARYWQLVHTKGSALHPRIQLAIAALNDAPEGTNWKAYLQEAEGRDYALQTALEEELYHGLSRRPARELNSKPNPVLMRETRKVLSLLDDLEAHGERQYGGEADEFDFASAHADELRKAYGSLQSYATVAPRLLRAVQSKLRSPAFAVKKAYTRLELDQRTILDALKDLQGNRAIRMLFTERADRDGDRNELTKEGAARREEFEAWFQREYGARR